MTEVISTIPSRIKNAAIDGHVCGAEDIDYGSSAIHIAKYDKDGNELSLESQIIAENTIYVIHHDFELEDDFTIPNNCVLYFEGGGISGEYTLTFSNNVLAGFPKILCDVAGNVYKADITWFGAVSGDNTIDSGAIINKVASITKHIIIPNGDFYIIDTPVLIAGDKIVDWYGVIHYIGTTTNIEVFVIYYLVTLNMYGQLICESPNIDYTGELGSRIFGLVVKNIIQRKVFVGDVYSFNVNLMIIGEGAGCAYNVFYINTLTHGNIGLLITQKNNAGGTRGYANENTFIGGRIKQYGTWDYSTCEAHAVVVKKIYNDDSYDRCNSLYFLRMCTEGPSSYIPYVFNNVSNVFVIAGRTEGVSNCARLSGRTGGITIEAIEGGAGIDYTGLVQSTLDNLFYDRGPEIYYQLDIHNPLYGEISNGSYIAKNLWQFVDVYGGNSSGALTYDTTKDLVNNIGFKVVFSDAKYNFLSLNVTNDGTTRRSYHINPIRKFDGTSIPADDSRENTVVRCARLNYNSVYHYFVDGADYGYVSLIFTPDVKEVMVNMISLRSVNVGISNGYITTGY